MSQKNSSALMGIIIVLAILFTFYGESRGENEHGKTLLQEIDIYFNQKFPAEGPGAVALVIKDGKTVLRKAYGLANLELGVPLKPEMVFRIGSITIQFTAACIMMLAEDGKLSLNDAITQFIPDYPTKGHKITLQHLLNHTSGIKSYDEIDNFYDNIRKDFKPHEFVEIFKNKPMDFQPEEQFKYNNSGYFLLGIVIEKASGMTYEDFVDERIFKPLGMTNSYYGSHSRIIPNRAAGYQTKDNGFANADYLSMSQMYAAGGLLSTADDLWTWTRALYSGKVVSHDSLKLMTTATRYGSGQTENYGYGFWLKPLFGEKVVEHNGGINGYLTHVLWMPERKIFVTVLTNALVVADAPFLARWTAALLCGKDVHRKKPITLDPSLLDEIVGVYKIAEKEFLTITREGTHLYSQTTGGQKKEIFASSENDLFYEDSFSHFSVVRDRNGQVIKMVMHSRGPDEEALKTDEKPTVRKPIGLDVGKFKDYEGEYISNDGIEISIRQKEGKFYAQLKGQPEFEIFPESENTFFFKVADAQLEFIRDAGGKVTGLLIHQGGRTLQMKRKIG
jgi:CubicO group peptidase (beta-lactamase class C family)